MTVDQLRSVLMNFGEKLDEEEIKELTKAITIQTDGTINYEGIFLSIVLEIYSYKE